MTRTGFLNHIQLQSYLITLPSFCLCFRLLSKASCHFSVYTTEPTPEREAVLQAGIDALERAKESTSFIGQVNKYDFEPIL